MKRTNSEGGYVTLAVLIVTGLLALIVSSLVTISRPAVGLARIGIDEVGVEALLDGGLRAAGYFLFSAEREVGDVDGAVLTLDDGSVRLQAMDEGGRIDLNGAEPELLAGLFTAAGGTGLDPDAFAARIVDWRDEDSDVSVGGAELNDYESEGMVGYPGNAPFRSVDELRMVFGVSPENFAKVAPYLTVYTAMPGVDPLTAPRMVLRAVPGLSDADIDRLIAARAEERDRELLVEVLSEYNDYLRLEATGVYRVAVHGELNNGFRDAIEAVLVMSPDGSSSYGVAAWSKRAPAAPSD